MIALAYLGLIVGAALIVTGAALSISTRRDDKDDKK